MIRTFLKFLFKRSSENAACVSIDAAQYMSPKHLKEIADYLRGLADDKKYREDQPMTDQERREKARRIAEAYWRIQRPGYEPSPDQIAIAAEQAYDKLCWGEAMTEVEPELPPPRFYLRG